MENRTHPLLWEKSCCFTGHRPEKLGRHEEYVRKELAREILAAYDDGCTRFLTGMSRGVDLWAAEEVLRLKEIHGEIRLVAAVPYEGFDDRWHSAWRESYRNILAQCEEIHIFSRSYTRDCFARRNRYMVDHACRVIAVFNGAPGGTASTLRYAQKLQRQIRVIDPRGNEPQAEDEDTQENSEG